jgi:hypothetical protein
VKVAHRLSMSANWSGVGLSRRFWHVHGMSG